MHKTCLYNINNRATFLKKQQMVDFIVYSMLKLFIYNEYQDRKNEYFFPKHIKHEYFLYSPGSVTGNFSKSPFDRLSEPGIHSIPHGFRTGAKKLMSQLQEKNCAKT